MTRILMVGLAFAAFACLPYESPPASSAATDTDTDTTTGSIVPADTHEGWRDADCWSCHEEDEHDEGMDPHECVVCHGNNGAAAGHTDLSPCNECHDIAHSGLDGFPDPASCQTCHPW